MTYSKKHTPCQCQPTATDNGEAVPTTKENGEKKARQYPPLSYICVQTYKHQAYAKM